MINLKIFKILFDMTRIGWIIVGILVYFLLGWILKDIVFSIITIEGDTTMGDILKYEQIVYSALTAIYIIIMNIVQGDDNGDSSSPIMLVIATYLGARFLPLSMGSVILYSVLHIVAIIWGACELKKGYIQRRLMEEFLMIILAGAVGGFIFSLIVKSENKRKHN